MINPSYCPFPFRGVASEVYIAEVLYIVHCANTGWHVEDASARAAADVQHSLHYIDLSNIGVLKLESTDSASSKTWRAERTPVLGMFGHKQAHGVASVLNACGPSCDQWVGGVAWT